MDLEFRSDFDEVRRNWRAFWAGELRRPILLITIPREGVEPVARPPWGAARVQSFESVCDQALRWAETHEFLGDAVPFHTPSLIIGVYEALMGARIEFIREEWGVDTHVVPFIEELGSFEARLDKGSEWWEKWEDLVETMKRKLAGRMVFGEGFSGHNLDQLSAMRGTTRFLMDLYDDPDGVHHALNQIQSFFDEFHRENELLMEYGKYGSVTRHGFYGDGIAGVPQSDAAFSIGKEHFIEFGLPYLKREIARLDHVEYHLDGEGNLTHLETICGIDDIHVIQWVPGSGAKKSDWSELRDRITELGKGQWLSAKSPERAKELWDRHGSTGRMILSCGAQTRSDAEAFVNAFDA